MVKKIIGKLHLWLGLISGPVVFIVALTGCLYAFQKEITEATSPWFYVKVEQENTLPPSALIPIANAALPDKKLHSLLYAEDGKSVQAIFYSSEPEYYFIAYLNPYSGKIIKIKDMSKDFFRFILDGHFYLWLPHEIGQQIVLISTIGFFVMLFSGLILWWPKNKAARKQRFTFSFKGRWRRKNYNWHNVSGFYALSLALVLGITGLIFGYQWLAQGIYRVLGGEKSVVYVEPQINSNCNNVLPALDALFAKFGNGGNLYYSAEYHIPETQKSSILLALNTSSETYYTTDFVFFNPHNLKEIPVNHIYGKMQNASTADKLIKMNYDIHIGAIAGFTGKCMAFLISLIIAALPITGCMIYLGRRKKSAKLLKSNVSESLPI